MFKRFWKTCFKEKTGDKIVLFLHHKNSYCEKHTSSFYFLFCSSRFGGLFKALWRTIEFYIITYAEAWVLPNAGMHFRIAASE